jgi:hypothetical protein
VDKAATAVGAPNEKAFAVVAGEEAAAGEGAGGGVEWKTKPAAAGDATADEGTAVGLE